MDSVVLPTRHSSTTTSVQSPPRMVRTASECSKNPPISLAKMAGRSSASRSSTSSSTLSLSAHYGSLTSPGRKKLANDFKNISVAFSPMITPLDNYYHNLEPAGMAGVYWRHYKAFTTVGEKVKLL